MNDILTRSDRRVAILDIEASAWGFPLAELVDKRSLAIAVIAFIFLPLTFITGLLGMNVEGIPFADRGWAFLWGA